MFSMFLSNSQEPCKIFLSSCSCFYIFCQPKPLICRGWWFVESFFKIHKNTPCHNVAHGQLVRQMVGEHSPKTVAGERGGLRVIILMTMAEWVLRMMIIDDYCRTWILPFMLQVSWSYVLWNGFHMCSRTYPDIGWLLHFRSRLIFVCLTFSSCPRALWPSG